MIRICLIGLLLFSSLLLNAQEGSLADTLHLSEVSVRASRLSVQRSEIRIDSLALAHNYSGDLAGLLEYHSPAFIKTAAPGSLATISLRGTLPSHTQVHWNGIRLNSPMLGQVDFSQIPSYVTDQVSIRSGPESVQTAAGGFGGQINLVSFLDWNQPWYGRMTLSAGSFETFGIRADFGANVDIWHFRIRLFQEQSENDFPFTNTANGRFNEMRLQQADYRKRGLLLQTAVRTRPSQLLTLQGWLQSGTRNLPAIMSYEGLGRTEIQEDESARFSGRWQWTSDRMSWDGTSGLSLEQVNYLLAHETGGGTLTNYHSASKSLSLYNRGKLEFSYNAIHTLNLSGHADYHSVDILDKVHDQGYQANRIETGIQLGALQSWNDRWASTLLLTQDWYDNQRSILIPTIAVTNQLAPALEVTLSLGRNYRAPTLNDLYWIPGGNPDLVPEEGYQGDLSFRHQIRSDSLLHINFEAAIFVNLIENWILWRPGEFRYWTPENLESVLARGLETRISAKRHLPRGKISLSGSYTYTRTNQIQPWTGSQLMYIPVHKGNLMLVWHFKKVFINWQSAYVSERFTSTGEAASYHRLPAYGLHHLGWGASLTLREVKVDLQLQVKNLFDQDYQAILWRAMPGRHFTLTLTAGI